MRATVRGAGVGRRLGCLAVAALCCTPVSAFVGCPVGLARCGAAIGGRTTVRPRAARTVITATLAEPQVKSTIREDPLLAAGTANVVMRAKMEKMLREVQDYVCKSVEEVDGVGKFQRDVWSREDGGGGVSAVMGNGKVWEKAGCNLAVVHGTMPVEALYAANDRLKSSGKSKDLNYKPGDTVPFFACGLSSVMHPRNPHCPTMHFNYRYFETAGGLWWFGGGTDITPSYLDKEDMKHFHGTYKTICDKHDPVFYPRFKKWADEYFTIKHRGETRGLGGIFFDDLNDRDADKLFEFCKEAGMAVPSAYLPIIRRHKSDPFTEEQKRWQLIRRGRYTEFNLVYDRGTIFGLKTGGRVESILMTLPETARWEYDHHPTPGSPEAEILDAFQKPREWV